MSASADIWSGMVAELREVKRERRRPVWERLKVGDRVLLLDDWAGGVEHGRCRAGEGTVERISPVRDWIEISGPFDGSAMALFADASRVVDILE